MRKSCGTVLYLTRDGQPVSLVRALDDTANALDGAHELCELVGAQVGEARGGARRAHEHVCFEKVRKRSESTIVIVGGVEIQPAGAAHVRPGTIGFRLTSA